MRILFAPDKFKGSLSGAEAARALAAGFRAGWPAAGRAEEDDLEMECLPVADGGEGTAEALCDALGGRWITRTVPDPLGRPVAARYALVEPADGGGTLAVVEMSAASGFGLVTGDDRDLLRANTVGTGELLRHARQQADVERVLIGIGGSATNDGGIGVAAALGWRFLDAAGRELPPTPDELENLASIAPPAAPWPAGTLPIVIACDVRNPLLGPQGATAIYGPQKGLRGPDEQARLERALTRLADVTATVIGRDLRDEPGAGAAGGLGFGLLAFCKATMRSGFEVVADLLRLEEAIARADLVVTGEGSLDGQTLEGKAPCGVATLAGKYGKPVVAFGGRLDLAFTDQLAEVFDATFTLAPGPMTLADCQKRAAELLTNAAARAARWLALGAKLDAAGGGFTAKTRSS
ncbi:MAG: glycerate kinase [Verrucomicrobia bacterium]|nr:glycerate kinase [Verrucomicrobiota bacterium]